MGGLKLRVALCDGGALRSSQQLWHEMGSGGSKPRRFTNTCRYADAHGILALWQGTTRRGTGERAGCCLADEVLRLVRVVRRPNNAFETEGAAIEPQGSATKTSSMQSVATVA